MSDSQNTFSPEMVATINAAYERAAERLDIRNAHSDRRAHLAKLIMDLAQAGETDGDTLCDKAVAGVKRSDTIRDRAHTIWQAEGQPNGQHDTHWRQAEQELDGVSLGGTSLDGQGRAPEA